MKSLLVIWALALGLMGGTFIYINSTINRLVKASALQQTTDVQTTAGLTNSGLLYLQAIPQNPEFQPAMGYRIYQ